MPYYCAATHAMQESRNMDTTVTDSAAPNPDNRAEPAVTPPDSDPTDLARRRATIAAAMIGRERELDGILAVVAAGRDLLLEGPPGTSKSTILRAITANWGIPLLLVEGNAELTPAKLIGHHSPSRVLREDYSADNFVPGPLTAAMQRGGFLYLEEFNRVPEDTLNALLTAMAERELHIPRVGRIAAAPTFRLVAAMNPYDTVGTGRISISIYDRLCRLAVGYQSVDEETAIVRLRSSSGDEALVRAAVAMTRSTREHPDVRLGSSVRGAIDLVLVAEQLRAIRAVEDAAGLGPIVLDAALLALSARISVAETSERTPESIIREIWENLFVLGPAGGSGEHRLEVDPDNATVTRRSGEAQLEPLARHPRPLDHAPTLFQPGQMTGIVVPSSAGAPLDAPTVPPQDGKQPGAATDEEGGPSRPAQQDGAARAEAARLARLIARRLAIRRPREIEALGGDRLGSVPYRYNSDDIDLDRTIEVLTERPFPEDRDIIVRDRVPTRQAVVLLVDVSGSMKGDKLTMAAATVGALAGAMRPSDEMAVIAFWKDAAIVQPLGPRRAPEAVLQDLLAIPARGLTNVAFALESALAQLRRTTARRRIVLLLSDAVHNAGPDPRRMARRLPRLDVLLETDGEHDVALGTDLARLGRGRLARVASYPDVSIALNHIFVR